MQDIGISAFRGANVRDGALGAFLNAVGEGKVQRGSYLIVESFDRLSRQETQHSLSLFLSITNKGINLVTLTDNHTYRAGSIDAMELMYSLMIMTRAHDESSHKSKRLLAAWEAKRSNGTKKRLTTKCPFWLQPKSDGKGFEVIPSAVVIVERIFRESIAGMGTYATLSRLNAERVPTFAISDGWAKSTVTKLLQSRSVLGEYQPHRLTKERKREPVGPPLYGYYPSIISQEHFELAQARRIKRRNNGAGRKGKGFSNLFGKVAVCGECGARMHYVNKGKPPKGGTYLVCSSALKHRCTNGIYVPYRKFEKDFLTYVRGIDISSLLDQQLLSDEERLCAERLDQAISKREIVVEQERRLIDLFADGMTESQAAREKLKQIRSELKALDTRIAQCKDEADRICSGKHLADDGSEEIAALIERLQGGTEDQYRLRAEIASRISALIERVSVLGPVDRDSFRRRWLDKIQSDPKLPEEERSEDLARDYATILADADNYLRPRFEITYADGVTRWFGDQTAQAKGGVSKNPVDKVSAPLSAL